MRKYQWLMSVMLIGCLIAFSSCRRMEQMIAPVMPDAEQVEPPPEMVETPSEMMPTNEGIGIFSTDLLPGHGLLAEAFYPGVKLTMLPDFDTLTPFHTWMVANIDVPVRSYTQGFPELGVDVLEDFAIRLRGQIEIETAGTYNFAISSDDGSKLFINGELLIDNDGLHGMSAKSNSIMLTAGFHDIEIQYFQGPRTQIGLQWFWVPPGAAAAIVPPEVLYPPRAEEMPEMPETPAEPIVEMEMPQVVGTPGIYWADNAQGKIYGSDLDGTNVREIVTNIGPGDIAVDPLAEKIYWTDSSLNGIYGANLDGTNVKEIVNLGQGKPGDIALVGNELLYWTNSPPKILRVNPDGTDLQEVLIPGAGVDGIAVDVANEKIYWTEWTAQAIRRANLDGTSVETLISTGVSGPAYVGLDVPSGKMYLIDHLAGKILRANLDGTDLEELITGLSAPSDMVLDLVARKMYWTHHHNRGAEVWWADLDGTNVENIIDMPELGNSVGIALSHLLQ